MPDAGVLATILLIAGLFLLALELMVPSFGLLGIGATVCLVISLWSAAQAWWGTEPGFFWMYLALWVGGIPSALMAAIYLIQNTSLGSFVVLRGPGGSRTGANPEVRHHLNNLVGQVGKSLSPLTPGGMVQVNGERHHAECLGPLVDPETPVTVVDTRGTRLLVRAVNKATTAPEITSPVVEQPTPASGTHERSAEDSPQLDFEIPENYTAEDASSSDSTA